MNLRAHAQTLLALAVALGILAVALGAYIAADGAVAEDAATRQKLAAEIVAKEREARASALAARSFRDIESVAGRIAARFVDDAGAVDAIGAIEAAAAGRAEVDVLSVAGGAGAGKTIDIALTVTGSFEDVQKTMWMIEALPYALSFVSGSVDLAPVEERKARSWRASARYRLEKAP